MMGHARRGRSRRSGASTIRSKEAERLVTDDAFPTHALTSYRYGCTNQTTPTRFTSHNGTLKTAAGSRRDCRPSPRPESWKSVTARPSLDVRGQAQATSIACVAPRALTRSIWPAHHDLPDLGDLKPLPVLRHETVLGEHRRTVRTQVQYGLQHSIAHS